MIARTVRSGDCTGGIAETDETRAHRHIRRDAPSTTTTTTGIGGTSTGGGVGGGGRAY